MSDPIRLFVGADGTNCDLESQAVLEWSVRKHTTADVEIRWMQQAAKGPWSGWRCETGRTPFTHFRWSIPPLCDYAGRAIYCDSDFIFVADIADLWAQPIPHMGLVRNATGKVSSSCILFDCAKARGIVPPLDKLRAMPDAHGTLYKYLREHPELVDAMDGNWDCGDLRGYELGDPRVKAIHYTRIETQLSLKHAVPRLARENRKHWYTGEVRHHDRPELQALFDTLLAEATANGYGIERYRIAPFAKATRKDFAYKQHRGTAIHR
jgi:hypothetical protein